jgi:cation diffusion facilitator CzcD-associated flavoprotein CzcO/acetyl esterase/lipase
MIEKQTYQGDDMSVIDEPSVTSTEPAGNRAARVDVAIVGAGFAGLYLLHRLRGLGFSVRLLEAADGVGGTWYWNRYPGARCDIQSLDYSYTFDSDLDAEWQWSEKYAAQPEILRYLEHVATKHDLYRSIEFSTRVDSAVWNDSESQWSLRTSTGESVLCRHYVMATGCLSVPKELDIEGVERFGGQVYFTSRWPHEGVDFIGKRVAVIGTGSSAIQSIPILAKQATELTVFQRTPNFSVPAYNGSIPTDKIEALNQDRAAYREAARWSSAGVPLAIAEVGAVTVSEEVRNATYEAAWQRSGIMEVLGTYTDHLSNPIANEHLSEFVRSKIRGIVDDAATAETLSPRDFPIGTKRLCVDTGYYETYNRPNVHLVDLRTSPIDTITEAGVKLGGASKREVDVDAIVFATGFDAMTGAMVSVDIEGRDGRTLKQAWADGPTTYLGLMAAGFPNLFMVTGPGSPSVLSNMAVSIEQHVDWITDCLIDMRANEFESIEPTQTAVDGWVQHVNDFASITLMEQANSWYMGANVPGKPRVFLPYVGGVGRYRTVCDEVVQKDYLGFARRSVKAGQTLNDGIIRQLQPDAMVMLEMMAELGLPPIESMAPTDARLFMSAASAMRAPGPEVGETLDGVFPGADGQDLNYRLHRPVGEGPHPIVVYFHGGGWVLGDSTSDDPLCRDLCVRSDSIVISVDYRHAPEARFPAAADDAFAAVKWAADNAASLGGIPGQLAVAGWSAGANLAAVVCQQVRDLGGPAIVGQLLLTPVTDSDTTRASYSQNGEGFALTASLMNWFWDQYADADQRIHPKASPLRAETLAGLPPAFIVTGEFDPLRDEGNAYAKALADAGVSVGHRQARGHIHTSIPAVDMLPTGEVIRAEMGEALRGFFA